MRTVRDLTRLLVSKNAMRMVTRNTVSYGASQLRRILSLALNPAQGSVRDRERREKERQQLADLVGKNLTAVSQLDGLTFGLYCDTVLPRVMEQIISCKDDIAQQYLMQALIQVPPPPNH